MRLMDVDLQVRVQQARMVPRLMGDVLFGIGQMRGQEAKEWALVMIS